MSIGCVLFGASHLSNATSLPLLTRHMSFPPLLKNSPAYRLLVIVLLVLAVVATACGADSGAEVVASGSSVSTPVPTVTAVVSPEPTVSQIPDVQASSTPDGEIPIVAELTERAMVHLRELSEGLPPRISGTDGELAAAGYVADQLRAFGYDICPISTPQRQPSPRAQPYPTSCKGQHIRWLRRRRCQWTGGLSRTSERRRSTGFLAGRYGGAGGARSDSVYRKG
jgi:hypothetical protein